MKKILVKLFWFLRFHELFRILFQRNKTTIIYYHDIVPELFDKHVIYLKKKYNIVSLEDYVNKKIEPKIKYRLIITFDDGHVNNFELHSIMKRHEISCTIFLVSNLVNTNKHFWFKWNSLTSSDKNLLKSVPNKEREQLLMDKFNFDKNESHDTPQALSLHQIRMMHERVSFQSHTHTHPCLNRCNEEESLFEIRESKKRIEEIIDNEVFALAFPNGDYEEKDIQNAKKCGYQCVLTSKGYYNSFEFNTFDLKRLSVNDFSSIKELALRSSGFYLFMKKFL